MSQNPKQNDVVKKWWIARIDGDTACFIYDNESDAEKRILSGIKLPPHWLGKNPYHFQVIEYSAYQALEEKYKAFWADWEADKRIVDGVLASNKSLTEKLRVAVEALKRINDEELNSQRPGGGYSRSATISYEALQKIEAIK